MAAPRVTNVKLQSLYRTFISGCHILHFNQVLDAYGHLSFRHPEKPEIFVMSRYVAPGTVSSPDDLIEYYVDNAEPVDPNSTRGYAERCIHSECYKRYPGVGSVIHSHSEEVIPYGISGVPLKPVYHMAGFLGNKVPVFEIADAYRPDDVHNMLVSNTHLGAALAAVFSDDPKIQQDEPDHSVVMMRGHGMTVVAPTMEDCVMRAIYTQKNASIQTKTLTMSSAYFGGKAIDIKYLSDKEASATDEMAKWSAMRPWKLWLREVESADLYVNMA